MWYSQASSGIVACACSVTDHPGSSDLLLVSSSFIAHSTFAKAFRRLTAADQTSGESSSSMSTGFLALSAISDVINVNFSELSSATVWPNKQCRAEQARKLNGQGGCSWTGCYFQLNLCVKLSKRQNAQKPARPFIDTVHGFCKS